VLLLGACVLLLFAGPVARAGAYTTRVHAVTSAHAAGLRPPSSGPAVRASRESSRARDVAATRIYIEANYRLVRVARANFEASEAGIHALVHQTISECPLAGEGSYTNGAANQVSEEVIGALETTAYRPDLESIHAFVAVIKHLHWDPRLTRIFHGYVVKLEKLAALVPPNICEDVKAFAANSFRAAPEGTIRFNKLYLAANIEVEEVPLRFLGPYEGPQEVALLRRTKQLEAPLADVEAKGVSEWQAIMRGLALSQ